MPRRHRFACALIALLLPALALAGEPAPGELRVVTILVQGLERVGREELLAALELAEGGPYAEGLEARLEQRARSLPYLRSLRVESRRGSQGMHLTLRVREASALRLAPYLTVLDDGDLDGGLSLAGAAPLGRGEQWRGLLLVGPLAQGSLRVDELRSLGPLPRLSLELGVSDYDDPFRGSQLTRWWSLAGPRFALPAAGRLTLLGGWERLDSEPARGSDPDGSEAQPLCRLELRQPLRGEGLVLSSESELRLPTDERGRARGEARLDARRRLGRWGLEARLAGGLAQTRCPATEIFFVDAWRTLRGQEIGSLPAREFQALRLRADFRLHQLEVSLRRNSEPEPVVFGPYFLLEGARFREYRAAAFAEAGDWGLGLGAILPGRPRLRASLGLQWNDAGEPTTLFLLEEH